MPFLHIIHLRMMLLSHFKVILSSIILLGIDSHIYRSQQRNILFPTVITSKQHSKEKLLCRFRKQKVAMKSSDFNEKITRGLNPQHIQLPLFFDFLWL